MDSPSPRGLHRLFWIFVSIHALFWTFVPPLIFASNRIDTAEMLMVGKHWLLSSYKHPGMQGWIVETLRELTGNAEFAPYLASQIAVVLCVWCVWKLGQKFLPETLALVAALAMLTYFFFNYESTRYNNHTFMRVFSALAVYWTYCAFESNRRRYWIGTGVALAASIYCNFTTFLLVGGIVTFMFVDRGARRYWRTSGPYLTTGVCFLLFIPLLVWLVQNNFAPFTYAGDSISSGAATYSGHLTWPLYFLFSQIPPILPIFIVLVPLLGVGWKWNLAHLWGPSTKDRFLTFMILFPLLVTTGIAAVHGHKIRMAIGCQIWIFLPVFLIYTAAKVRDDWTAVRRSLKLTAGFIVFFAFFTVVLVYYAPRIQGHASRTHYPAQQIAQEVTQCWEEHFNTPLAFVRGDDWPGMAVVLYGETSPDEFSPLWMSEEEFRQKGGVLLWQKVSENEKPRIQNHFANKDFRYTDEFEPDPEWLAKFPNRLNLPPLIIPQETPFDVPPAVVGIALVPPESPPKEAEFPSRKKREEAAQRPRRW